MKLKYINSNRSKSIWKFLLLLLVCGAAQNFYGQSKNEVSINLSGSFSKLDYKFLQEENNMENGFSLGAGYSYYLSQNWSLVTGLELQYMEGSAYLPSVNDAYPAVDFEGEDFEFRYRYEDFRQNQYVYFLNLPLKLQYETGKITRFYAAAGAKVGVVLQSEYEVKASSLTTSGYYKQYDAELRDPQFAGFGDFGALNTSKADLGIKTNLVLSLETGLKFMLDEGQAFYMGVFLDYGLKDIKPEDTQESLLTYSPENPTDFENNSLFTSENKLDNTSYVDEVKTLAFGLKFRYAFSF